jgi:UrcA family protein
MAQEVPARTVHYGDLNLNTKAGEARLHARIVAAAEQVCGDVGDRQLERAAAAKACVDRAVAAGMEKVGMAKPVEVAALR